MLQDTGMDVLPRESETEAKGRRMNVNIHHLVCPSWPSLKTTSSMMLPNIHLPLLWTLHQCFSNSLVKDLFYLHTDGPQTAKIANLEKCGGLIWEQQLKLEEYCHCPVQKWRSAKSAWWGLGQSSSYPLWKPAIQDSRTQSHTEEKLQSKLSGTDLIRMKKTEGPGKSEWGEQSWWTSAGKFNEGTRAIWTNHLKVWEN